DHHPGYVYSDSASHRDSVSRPQCWWQGADRLDEVLFGAARGRGVRDALECGDRRSRALQDYKGIIDLYPAPMGPRGRRLGRNFALREFRFLVGAIASATAVGASRNVGMRLKPCANLPFWNLD